MGSAVSAASGILGGVVGGVAEGMTPKIGTANQSQMDDVRKKQINAAQDQGLLQTNRQGMADVAYGQATGQIGQANSLNNSGNVENSLALLQAQANGTAPSAAEGVLQQGKDQAIASQMAMANSGNLSQMIGGQKTAMDNAANLTQQSANQASQLRANQQALGQQQYAGASSQQVQNQTALGNASTGIGNGFQNAALGYGQLQASNLANAGGLATSGASLQQGVNTQNAQNQVQAAGGLMNGAGGALAMLSDENQKKNVSSDQASRAKGISNYFRDENKKDEPKAEKEESRPAPSGYADDDPRKKRAQQIKEGFMSDENTKQDIKKDSMLHAFLDKLEPVTFDYKNPDGEMGKTPGTHMGIIAQDVEKAPGGESMIIETPEGKAIDMASAMGMLMSAAADAHDRMSSLEELFKSKKVK